MSDHQVRSAEEVSNIMDKIFKPPTGKQLEAMQHVNRGANLFSRGRWAEAEKEFKMAAKIDPMNATAHGNIGWLFLRQERFDEAIRWLEKALELNPNLKGAAEGLSKAKKATKNKTSKKTTLDGF